MNLDKSTLEYLEYIYQTKECTFREFCKHFEVVGVENAVYPAAMLTSFVHSGYVAIFNPTGDLIFSHNLFQYFRPGTSFLSPDSRIIILPEGAYRVEQMKYKAYALWIPIVISLFSLSITVLSILLQ